MHFALAFIKLIVYFYSDFIIDLFFIDDDDRQVTVINPPYLSHVKGVTQLRDKVTAPLNKVFLTNTPCNSMHLLLQVFQPWHTRPPVRACFARSLIFCNRLFNHHHKSFWCFLRL
jgi:hypothetical protein